MKVAHGVTLVVDIGKRRMMMNTIQGDTRENILNSAYKVFIEKGLMEIVMNDIANAVGVSRRTLYRYFATKEDIAYEVMLHMLGQWNHFQQEMKHTLTGTGIEQLEQFFHLLIGYMEENRYIMHFLGEFDFYFKDNASYEPPAQFLEHYLKIVHVSENHIQELIQKGIEDKSILLKHDMNLTVVTLSSFLWSYGQRIAIMGKKLSQEFQMDVMDIIRCQVDMYIEVLSATRRSRN